MGTEGGNDAFVGNPETRTLCEQGIKVKSVCNKAEQGMNWTTDQGEGGKGIAANCTEDVPPRCVNCDVYRWTQVK